MCCNNYGCGRKICIEHATRYDYDKATHIVCLECLPEVKKCDTKICYAYLACFGVAGLFIAIMILSN